jgi:hypothetical protein
MRRLMEARCHWCHHIRAGTASSMGRHTCADCRPLLRVTDVLGYLRCAACHERAGARADGESVVHRDPARRWAEDRCDGCGV